MSLTKVLTHSGNVEIHRSMHFSTLISLSSASNLAWSPCVRIRIMYSLDALPRKWIRSRSACPSSSVNREPYFTTNMIASNPFGASWKILCTSFKICFWTCLFSLVRGIDFSVLTVEVSRTPGVSITEIRRSMVLVPFAHFCVTDEASDVDSNPSFPMILFPVKLFPLPVFPRRTTVSSFPLGS